MNEQEQISLFQVIADLLEVDEAEVIDNCDGETVTVCGSIYQIIDLETPIKLGDTTYYWTMLEIYP